MSTQKLLTTISAILQEKGLSERKAGLHSGVGIDFIRNMRRNGNPPKSDKLMKLAKYLNVPIDHFLQCLDDKPPQFLEDTSLHPLTTSLTPLPITTLYVRGDIQAGQWREATEWPMNEWVPVTVPINLKYRNFPSYALYVRGDSMNLVYPDGTIIIIINFSDLGKLPEDGDCVVTIRRDSLTDCYEATLKIVQIKEDGSILLWPRSNNPNFLKPIALPKMTTQYQANGMDGDCAATPDILIQGLVVGSYQSAEKIYI